MEQTGRPVAFSKIFALKPAACLLLLITVFFLWHERRKVGYDRPPNDPDYLKILNGFQAAQPTAMNVSPDGKYLLVKSEEKEEFKISVIDRDTKQEVRSYVSKNVKRSLTWRPDSRAIVFQEFSGMDRPLYTLDIQSGEKLQVNAPVSQTALPPVRWNPTGKRIAYFNGDWRTGDVLVVDLMQADQPVVVDQSLRTSCDFVWSPDGTRLAVATDTDGTVTVITVHNLQKTRYQIFGNSEGAVHNLAWSPDGNSILVTARGAADEFFRLFEIETRSGRISAKAEGKGDISYPVWMPDAKTFIYHVTTNGFTSAFYETLDGSTARRIGPTDGVIQVLGPSTDGKSVYAHFSSLTAPPVLGEVLLSNGEWRLLYSPPGSAESRCPSPELITLKSRDGVAVPAFRWPGKRQPGIEPSVLIVAHGGEHTQTYPTWEEYIRLMTDLGCDVIAQNHRRSSGYGHKYELLEGDAAEDILAASNYARDVLKVKPNRIFLTGLSTGSRLIAEAASHGDEFGGLFLVSWPGRNPPPNAQFNTSYPIFEFHGELDVVMSPAEARKSIEQFFLTGPKKRNDISYHVYRDEGHFFYQSESLAAIYWQLAKRIQPAQ